MGKTNLLDALHYLSFGKSHLNITDTLAVQRGEEMAILQAQYMNMYNEEEELLLSIRPGRRKVLKRNKKEYQKLSEHIGRFPIVMVSPQDYQLILGGSDERRRFLDQLLSQEDPAYLSTLIQYNKNLQQRNYMLREKQKDSGLMEVIEMQMARFAQQIYTKRKLFIELFVPVFNKLYKRISAEHENAGLSYQTQLTDEGDSLLAQLQDNRERDYYLGYSSRGIHKDDLEMTLDDVLIRRIGSEGQNKSFLISLKLAQFKHLQSLGGETPMLLLDDIFDKLDSKRVEQIIHLVGGDDFGQIFITDTNRKYLDEIIASWGDAYKLFNIDHGVVLSV